LLEFILDISNPWIWIWNKFIDATGEGSIDVMIKVPLIFFTLFYWIVGGILFALNFIPFFNRFKIQRDKKVDTSKLTKVVFFKLLSNPIG